MWLLHACLPIHRTFCPPQFHRQIAVCTSFRRAYIVEFSTYLSFRTSTPRNTATKRKVHVSQVKWNFRVYFINPSYLMSYLVFQPRSFLRSTYLPNCSTDLAWSLSLVLVAAHGRSGLASAEITRSKISHRGRAQRNNADTPIKSAWNTARLLKVP